MFENFTAVRKAMSELMAACSEFAAAIGDKSGVRLLAHLKSELETLGFNIAIIGDIKRGKSTLINTLLGQDTDAISPVDNRACTSAIVRYHQYKPGMEPEPHAVVSYEDETKPCARVSYKKLRSLISQQENPNNIKAIRAIDVYGEFPLLGNCTLVDTPGRNATIERHGEMVQECLPTADAIIIPIMTEQPMTNDEQELLRQLSTERQRSIFYVVTMMDEIAGCAPEELEELREWIRSSITNSGLREPERIYEVAALKVFEARQAHAAPETIDALREQWGIRELEEALSNFLLNESNEWNTLQVRVSDALDMMHGCMSRRRLQNKLILSNHKLTQQEDEQQNRETQRRYDVFCREMEGKLRQFSISWKQDVQQAMDQLTKEEAQKLINEVRHIVDNGSLREVFTLKNTIAEKATPYIQAVIQPLAIRLNGHALQLRQDFAQSCQALCDTNIEGEYSGGDTAATLLAFSPTLASLVAIVPAVGGIITAASGVTSILGFTFGTAALISALTAAIIPTLLGAAALACAGPLGKYIAKKNVPEKVDKALEMARTEISEKMDKMQQDIVEGYHRLLKEKQEQLNTEQAELRKRLFSLNAEEKARAETENDYIADMLERLSEAERDFHRLSAIQGK